MNNPGRSDYDTKRILMKIKKADRKIQGLISYKKNLIDLLEKNIGEQKVWDSTRQKAQKAIELNKSCDCYFCRRMK